MDVNIMATLPLMDPKAQGGGQECTFGRIYHTMDKHREIQYTVSSTAILHSSAAGLSRVVILVEVTDWTNALTGTFCYYAAAGLGQMRVRAMVHDYLKTATLKGA